jgi:hypothetical protein
MLNSKLTQSAIREKVDLLIRDAKGYPDIVDVVAEVYGRFRSASEVRGILEDVSLSEYREVALPLEDSQCVEPPMDVGDFEPSGSGWARRALEGNVVIGLDTSEILPSIHRSPAFLLVNTGYSMITYCGESKYLEGCRPYFYPYGEILEKFCKVGSFSAPSWAAEVIRMECESDTLTELCSKMGGVSPFVLFDESFSALYLTARSSTHRQKVVERLEKMLLDLVRSGVTSVGAFYTSSSAFVAMIRKCFAGDQQNWRIRDSALFKRILRLGWRSPAFRVRNEVIEESNLRIAAFYVKTGVDSVIRVEFPEEMFQRVADIHRVVVAQSALGGGYPYVMQRAHEQAYIKPGERRWVLDYLNRLLAESGLRDAVKVTRKEMRKIVGVV